MDGLLVIVGLTSALIAAGWLLLPVISWLRTSRVSREVAELRARLEAVEARLAAAQAAAPSQPAQRPEPEASAPADVAAPAAAGETSPLPLPLPQPVFPPAELAAPEPSLPPPPSDEPPTSLEDAIGGRLMLWVGAVVLVLGVGFFLKYAFDNAWITEPMRVALGLLAGGALIAAGVRFQSRGYRAYGQILAGGGLAVLYLAVYAAFSFYALIGRTPAFVALVVVTAGAATLADRHRAIGLALMAVGGGFLAPFLVGGGTGAQVTLFTYDALLVVGALYLANRQDWPSLNAVSFVLTVFTIAAWAGEYYAPHKWLRTELFLTLFCVLFLLILRAQVSRRGWRHPVSIVLAGGPLLYHLASLAVLEPHGVAVLVYLIAATMAAVGMAVRAGSTAWRLSAWVAVFLPLVAWVESHQTARWMTANLISATAIFSLHALAQLDRVTRLGQPLTRADNLLQHLNGYGLLALLYIAVEQVSLASAPLLALAAAAVHAAFLWRFWTDDRRAALNALAVALGAVTVALAVRLDGPWLTVALAVEGAAIAVIGWMLAERSFRIGGALLLAAAVVRYFLLSLPASPSVFRPVASEPFAMGLVLAALLYALAWYARRQERERAARPWSATTAAVVSASVLVVVACSAHNWDYWRAAGLESADARFAASLALSGIWTLLASVFIGVGMARDFAPLRYLAMALFGVTVLKVFLADLSSLGGIYRILGFIGVGVVLLAVSFFYQRGRRKGTSGPASAK